MTIVEKGRKAFEVCRRSWSSCVDCAKWEPIPFHDDGGVCMARATTGMSLRPTPRFQVVRVSASTSEVAGKAGITHKTACEVLSRQIKVQRQPEETIARYQTPRGLAGLAVMMMDLFVRLDPR